MADTKTLAEALCAAQGQMQNPKKDKTAKVRTRTGGEYTYNYTTLDAVLDVVRPALNENGVFLSQRSEVAENGMLLQTAVMYGDSVQVLDVTPYQYDSDPQEFGKRETYARRYSLLKAFGLAGDDDTDGDTGSGGTTPPSPRATAKRKPDDKRKKMLARIAQLKAKLMERGLTEEGLDAYLPARYKVDSIDKLTDEQLIDYGKQLAKTVEEQKEGKADVD